MRLIYAIPDAKKRNRKENPLNLIRYSPTLMTKG